MPGVPQRDPLAGFEWLEQAELDHVYVDMPFPDKLIGLANQCAWAALQLTVGHLFSNPLTQPQAWLACRLSRSKVCRRWRAAPWYWLHMLGCVLDMLGSTCACSAERDQCYRALPEMLALEPQVSWTNQGRTGFSCALLLNGQQWQQPRRALFETGGCAEALLLHQCPVPSCITGSRKANSLSVPRPTSTQLVSVLAPTR